MAALAGEAALTPPSLSSSLGTPVTTGKEKSDLQLRHGACYQLSGQQTYNRLKSLLKPRLSVHKSGGCWHRLKLD